jgi:nitroreductase
VVTDVLADIERYTAINPRSAVRPVSCPVDPLRRFVGRARHVPARGVAELCRLLEWAYGHRAPVEAGQRLTRRAPSAGGLYPTEVFVVTADQVGYYDFAEHRLHPVDGADPAPVADRLGLAPGQCGVVLASVLWRTVQRYGTRGYRYCLLDAANVAGNLTAAAAATGHRVAPTPVQPHPGLDVALGLRHGELGLLALSVMPGPRSAAIPDPLHQAPPQRRTGVMNEQPPMLSPALQRAVWLHGRCSVGSRQASSPWSAGLPRDEQLFTLLDRRYSARDFTGRPPAEDDLAVLAAAGTSSARGGFTTGTPEVRLTALDCDPATLAVACQGQGIVARSSAAFVLSADSAQIRAHSHAGYRRAVINAGLATATLYRVAAERDVATTVIGGFVDADVARLMQDANAHPIVIQVFGRADHAARKVDAAPVTGAGTP